VGKLQNFGLLGLSSARQLLSLVDDYISLNFNKDIIWRHFSLFFCIKFGVLEAQNFWAK